MKHLFPLLCVILFGSLSVSAQTYGCNDSNACNFVVGDPAYDVNSGCAYAGDACDDENAATFSSVYASDCSCVGVVTGCMDPEACNYKSDATNPSGCLYVTPNPNVDAENCWVCSQDMTGPSHGNGQGVLVSNDMNNNGVCDELDIIGCTDAAAANFNYDSEATALNSFGGSSSPCAQLHSDEEFNFAGLQDEDGVPYRLATTSSVSHDVNDFDNDGNMAEFGSPGTNPWAISENDKVVLVYGSDGLPTNGLTRHAAYVEIWGDADNNGTSDFNEIEGCMDEDACNYNEDATRQPSDEYDTDTEEWDLVCNPEGDCECNGQETANILEGKCNCDGDVEDALGDCNGNCTADVLPTGGNGICDSDDIEGCMNSAACNYNKNNTYQDGTDADRCNFPSDECGCLFTGLAGNDSLTFIKPVIGDYADAVLESGFVIETICDCRGAVEDAIGLCKLVHPLVQNGNAPQDPDFCFADVNTNGVCDKDETSGCTDNEACNFEGATLEDNSCKYYNECGECLPSTAPTDWSPNQCDCQGNEFDVCNVCNGEGQTNWYRDADDDGYGDANDFVVDCPNSDGTAALNSPGYVANSADCNDNDSNVGGPDECGVCGGSGGGYVEGVTCGCKEWGSFETDGSCGCTQTAPFIKIYPLPGRDCNGDCINGTDEDGLCIIESVREVTAQPAVYTRVQTGPKAIVNHDVFAMERWMANIDTLHSRMSKNLDDGSYGGYSDTLTIEKAIINNGTLNSRGESRIGGDYLVVPDPAAAPLVDSVYFFQDPLTGVWDIPIFTTDVDADGEPILDENGDPRTTQIEETPSQYKDSISINTNLFVGGRLRVKSSTFSDGGINTTSLKMSGDLTVGGSLTVKGESDQWGNAIMQDSLWVRKGAITVGQTNDVLIDGAGHISASDLVLRDTLHVAEKAVIGGHATIHDGLIVNTSLTSSDKPSFEVKVEEGASLVRVNSELSVNDIAKFNAGMEVVGKADFTNEVQIKGTGNFDGKVDMAQTLEVHGESTLKSLHVKNQTHIGNKLFVGGPTVGSSGYREYRLGQTSPQSSPKWPEQDGQDSRYSFRPYQMVVDGTGGSGNAGYNGILIRLEIDEQFNNFQNGNNFVTFQRGPTNKVSGRIEGETIPELPNNGGYIVDQTSGSFGLISASTALGISITELVYQFGGVASEGAKAIAAVIPGAGLTDSDVAEGVAGGVVAAVETAEAFSQIAAVVAAGLDLAYESTGYGLWMADLHGAIGVTYASGAGDYAEWIEKEDAKVDFLPGEVVGVRAGLVSYDTQNSDHNLVISTKPMMLGNEVQGDMSDFEKVAFMGQVPIRVQGMVNQGDYILPSGESNGFSRAVPRDEIAFDELPNIVGVAWESGTDNYFNVVNCSVGLDRQGSAQLVQHVQNEFLDIRRSISNEISLSVLESGLYSERRTNRMKKRKAKRNAESSMFLSKPDRNSGSTKEQSAVRFDSKPAVLDMSRPIESGLNQESVGPMQVQNYLETELADFRAEINALLNQKPEIGPAEVSEAIQAISNGLEELDQAYVPGSIEFIKTPYANPEATKVIQKFLEKTTVRLMEHFVSPETLKSMVQEQLREGATQMKNVELLKAYPSGSLAEQKLVDGLINDVFDSYFETHPTARKYRANR